MILRVLPVFCALFVWAAGPVVAAHVYRWTDGEGNAHLSDQPPPSSASGGKDVTRQKVSDSPAGAPAGGEGPKEFVIPFQKVYGGMLVHVVLNDRVHARMLVDTGATSVRVSTAIVNQLDQYKRSDAKKIRVLTAGGVIEAREITLEKVDLGGAVKFNVRAAFTDESLDHASYDGLLGISFLSGFRMTIDYDLNMIHLTR